MGRERSRSRSRSPRRKERRRSRSRDRGDKKLDKFGRDVTRNERPGRSSNDVSSSSSSSSSRKRESKDYRGRDEDSRRAEHERIPSSYYEERESDPTRDERRQKMKEMFEAQEEDMDEDTKRMSQIMGIQGFDTTKGKKVNDQVKGYAKINKTQRYRQYMNRRGGFNRPLDWVQ